MPAKRRRDHVASRADYLDDPDGTRGVYVCFMVDGAWDFTDGPTYTGPRRAHEFEIRGLGPFMTWAREFLQLAPRRSVDEHTLDRLVKQLKRRDGVQ